MGSSFGTICVATSGANMPSTTSARTEIAGKRLRRQRTPSSKTVSNLTNCASGADLPLAVRTVTSGNSSAAARKFFCALQTMSMSLSSSRNCPTGIPV